MKSRYILTLCCALALFTACDHIDEDERYIEVKAAEVARAVLIEDFTGQRCNNCPLAAEEIERLKEQYGDDKIIAVGIHSSELAVFPTARVVGLRTVTGDEYYKHFNIEVEPSLIVNRTGKILTYQNLGSAVYTAIQESTPLEMTIANSFKSDSRQLSIEVTTSSTQTVGGKLQLWIVEDGITAIQVMPDGTSNTNYVHNHVFRTAVNGTWGDDFSLQQGEQKTASYTQQLSDEWNAANVSVVAFVYDDSGVLQVCKQKIIN